MDIKEKIRSLPVTSGVYLMKDASGQVIYIGKAVSLRKRVPSYFRASQADAKTSTLVSEIRDIDYIPTHSEAEALILEASLVKKYMPRFNISLRDDKSYPYIEITKEKFPRVFIVRPKVKKQGSVYYGPYVSPRLIREALTFIRKIFRFCTCKKFPRALSIPRSGDPEVAAHQGKRAQIAYPNVINKAKINQKACLDYHLGLCSAPCIGSISQQEYARNIRNIRIILEGKKDQLYKNLRREMERLAHVKKYEQAATIRDQIQALGALYSSSPDVNFYKETEQLQLFLHLPRRPERIEAFDISHIMGHLSVGSMVSFLNGKPDKNSYRRFRIKEVGGIDDCKMIAEIVKRRYRRLKNERRPFPDLIVIDGGKGQLSAACRELKELDLDIPIMSLAKREEEIFLPHRHNPVILSRASLGLRLVERIRDEAHRFAIAYHRTLRHKNVFKISE